MGKQKNDPILSQITANRQRYLADEQLNKEKIQQENIRKAKTPESVMNGTDPDYGAPVGFQDQVTFGSTREARLDSSRKLIEAELKANEEAKKQKLIEEQKKLAIWNDPAIQEQFRTMNQINSMFFNEVGSIDPNSLAAKFPNIDKLVPPGSSNIIAPEKEMDEFGRITTKKQKEVSLDEKAKNKVSNFLIDAKLYNKPISENIRGVLDPIVGGKEKMVKGVDEVLSGDVLRGSAHLLTGTLQAAMNMIPAVVGLNATMPIMNQIGKSVAEGLGYTKEEGEKVTGLIAPFLFGKWIGASSLVSFGVDEGIKETGILDSMKPEDQIIMRELIGHMAFFGTLLGGKKIQKSYLDPALDKAFPYTRGMKADLNDPKVTRIMDDYVERFNEKKIEFEKKQQEAKTPEAKKKAADDFNKWASDEIQNIINNEKPAFFRNIKKDIQNLKDKRRYEKSKSKEPIEILSVDPNQVNPETGFTDFKFSGVKPDQQNPVKTKETDIKEPKTDLGRIMLKGEKIVSPQRSIEAPKGIKPIITPKPQEKSSDKPIITPPEKLKLLPERTNKINFDELDPKLKVQLFEKNFASSMQDHNKKIKLKDGSTAYIHKKVNEDLFYVYDESGNRIGAAAFDTTPKDHFTGYISNQSIFVNDDQRRKGIATNLIKYAEEFYGIPYKPSKLLSPEMEKVAISLNKLTPEKSPIDRSIVKVYITDDKVLDIKNRIEKTGGEFAGIDKDNKESMIYFYPAIDHPGATKTKLSIPLKYYKQDPGSIDREVRRLNKKYINDLKSSKEKENLENSRKQQLAEIDKRQKESLENLKKIIDESDERQSKFLAEKKLTKEKLFKLPSEDFVKIQDEYRSWLEKNYPELGDKPEKKIAPIKVKRKIVVKQGGQRPQQKLVENAFYKVQEINDVVGSQKLVKQKEARDLAQQLRSKGINAKVEKDGKKWYLYLDGIKQNMHKLGLVEKPEIVPINKIKIKYPDAQKKFRDLTAEQRSEQVKVIEAFVEPEDLPSGYGQKIIDKALADIRKGKWNTPEAQLVRDAAVDILTEGKDIKKVKGSSETQFLSGEEIRAFVNEEKIKSDFEPFPPDIFNAKSTYESKIKKIQDNIDFEMQAMFPDEAKIQQMENEIKKIKMQQAQEEARLNIDADIVNKIKDKIEKEFDVEKSSLAELKNFQAQLESKKDKLSESSLKLLERINRKIKIIESIGEQENLFEPDQGSLFNAKTITTTAEDLPSLGKDVIGRNIPDWKNAVVFHSTDKKSMSNIRQHGFRLLENGEQSGYYGKAISFTPDYNYSRDFGDHTAAVRLDKDIKILNLNSDADWETFKNIIKNVDASKYIDAVVAAGYDGLYDAGAGDLFIGNAKVLRLLPDDPETHAFSRWYGNSVLKDFNGDPVVVYHGTNERFTTVKMNKGAMNIFWFSSNPQKIASGNAGAAGNKIIMDLYIKLENPAGWKEYNKYGLSELKFLGYDGALLPDGEGGFDGFVFEPTQVKSASRNNGNYSPEKQSMLMNARAPKNDGKKIDPVYQAEIYSIAKATGLKKIKVFKTEEGTFEIYDVSKEHRRGDMFTLLKDKNGYVVRNANVPKDKQRYGLATEFYIAANNESIRRTGNPLRSSPPRTLSTGQTIIELSDDGVALWDSFVRKGLAEKIGYKNYRFYGGKAPKHIVPDADVKDLIAVHNLTGSNLLFADKMNGLAMPSMAIVRAQQGFDKYGEITLVANNSLINPEYTRVFNRDIYSPTYPTVYRHINKNKLLDIVKKINQDMPSILSAEYFSGLRMMMEKIERGNYVMTDFLSSEGLIVDYLSSKNMLPEPILKRELLQSRHLPEFDKQYEVAQKILKKYPILTAEKYEYDPNELQSEKDKLYKESPEYYDRQTDKDEFLEYRAKENLREKIQAQIKEAAIKFVDEYRDRWIEDEYKNDPELFQEIKNIYKRDPEAYFDEYSVQKDIKRLLNPKMVLDWSKYNDMLNKLRDDNLEDFTNYIEKKFEPVFGEEYLKAGTKKVPHTLENAVDIMSGKIRGAEKTLVQGLGKSAVISATEFSSIDAIKKAKDRLVDRETFEKKEDEMRSKFMDLSDKLGHYYKYPGEFGFEKLDNLSLAIGKIAATKMDNTVIKRILSSTDYGKVPEYYYDDVREVAKLMKDMPTEYFEAKKSWKVKLNEFSGAVVPITTPQKILDVIGKYKLPIKTYDPNIPGDRTRALNEFSDQLFDARSTFNRINREAIEKNITEYHAKSVLLKDTKITMLKEDQFKALTFEEWIRHRYNPIDNGFQLIKKGDKDYEPGKTKYRAQIFGGVIQPSKANGWKGEIIHSRQTDMATGLEETIHIFQAEVKRKYPELAERIAKWENAARSAAAKFGIKLPLDEELFAKSFVAQYGYEMGQDTVQIPSSIFEDVVKILNESTTGEKILDKYYNPREKFSRSSKIHNVQVDPHAYAFDRKQLELFSIRANAPPFYSKMQNILANKLPAKFIKQQALDILKSGEIKDSEIKWSGIEEWLENISKLTEKIDKEDLINFLKANALTYKTITYEDKSTYERRINSEIQRVRDEIKAKGLSAEAQKILNEINDIKEQIDGFHSKIARSEDAQEAVRVRDQIRMELFKLQAHQYELQEQLNKQYEIDYKDEYARLDELNERLNDVNHYATTKYRGYVIPGGENYQEILFQLPVEIKWSKPNYITADPDDGTFVETDFDNKLHRVEELPPLVMFKDNNIYKYYLDGELKSTYNAKNLNEAIKYFEDNWIKNYNDNRRENRIYQSPHWSDENVFAHTRVDDRMISHGYEAEDKTVTYEKYYTIKEKLFRNQDSKYYEVIENRTGEVVNAYRTREEALVRAIKEFRNNYMPKKIEKKHLFMQEVQSDWSLDGRRRGYANNKQLKIISYLLDQKQNELTELRQELLKKYNYGDQPYGFVSGTQELENRLRYIYDSGNPSLFDKSEEFKEAEKYFNLVNETSALLAQNIKLLGGVPDMPFKNNWHEFVVKSMLRKAAEDGYDYLSWTTGQQQIERYDLSKIISNITYESDFTFKAVDHEGVPVINKVIQPEDLPEFIGKDLTEKLLAQKKNNNGEQTLSEVDLKLGGEWAYNLYDKAIPSFLNKFAKKFGAKVEKNNISSIKKEDVKINEEDGFYYIVVAGHGYYTYESNGEHSFSERKRDATRWTDRLPAELNAKDLINQNEIHSLEITPAMRESVLSEGLPLFNAKKPKEEPDTPRIDKYIKKVLESMPEKLSPEKEARLSELKKFKELTPEERTELKNLKEEKAELLAEDPFERHRLSSLIKMKIRSIRTGYKIGAEERQKQLTDLKKDIAAYARLVLPRADYRKSEVTPLLTELAKAKDLDGTAKAFTRIKDLERKVRKRVLISKINKLIRNADRTKGDPDFVVAIKNIRKLKPEDVEKEIAKIYERAATRELTDEEDQFLYLLQRFSYIKNKSVDELEDLYKELYEAIKSGRNRRKEWLAKEKERIQDLTEKTIFTITGGKQALSDDVARAEGLDKEKLSLLERLSDVDSMMHSWEWILDKLSKHDKTSAPMKSFLNLYFGDKIFEARNAEDKGMRENLNLLRNKMLEIYGTSKFKLTKQLNKNSERQDTNAYRIRVVERDESGLPTKTEKVKLIMSQNEAAYMLMVHEDPQLEKTFDKMGYTDETWNKLKDFVDPKVMRWAKWQLEEFYPNYYKGVNEVYKAMRGVDLQFNKKYMPISRDVSQTVLDQEFLGDNNTDHVSIYNGHLQPRVANTNAIKIQDIDRVLIEHIIEMEHFKAFAAIMKDLRGVFGNKNVSKAIKQYHSKTALQVINRFINDFARGGVDRKLTVGLLDKIRANFAKSVIGLNPVVFIKQLTSIPAYMMEIPVKDFAIGMVDFMLNPIGKTKFLYNNSEVLKSRYSKGWERDIILAMQRARKTTAKELSGRITFTDIIMSLAKYGDGAAIFAGGWSVYKYSLKKELSSGKPFDIAKANAIKEFEKATKRSQQAGDVEDLGEIQRQGSWAKMWTLFKTAPKQYYSNMSGAMRNLLFKRGTRTENLKRIFVAHVLLPQLFQWAANGFNWDSISQIKALAIGSLNGILIAGDILESALNAIMGDVIYSADDTPITAVSQDLYKALKQINKYSHTFDKDIESLFKTIDELASALSKFIGLPYDPVKKVAKGVKDYAEDPTNTNELRLVGYSDAMIKHDVPEKSDTLKLIQERQLKLNEMKKEARKTMNPDDIEKAKQYEKDLKLLKSKSLDWKKKTEEEKSKRLNDPFKEPKKPNTMLGKKLLPGLK